MMLKSHVAASAAVGAGLYAATSSIEMAAASFAAGVFLDLDHLIDYWHEHSFNLDVRRFFDVCRECDLEKTRLFAHSAELLALAASAAYFTRSALLAGLALGMCQHLAFDQFVNKVYPGSYFLVVRWLTGFKAETVFSNIADLRGNKNGNDQEAAGSKAVRRDNSRF